MGIDTGSWGESGANQSGLRGHNARLILTTIQRKGAMAGSQLARETGLSAQTVSNILRALEEAGLVTKGDPQRGRVGKPSIPMCLAADGALGLGLKVGRRSADLALMGLDGTIRGSLQETYRYPEPAQILRFLETGLAALLGPLPKVLAARVCGIGIAAPSEIWSWQHVLGAPAEAVAAWRGWDMPHHIAAFTDLPVFEVNDATAACRAENVFGASAAIRDYAYLYVGALIGGGVVLDHRVWEGNQHNAGAFGPLRGTDAQGRSAYLMDTASLYRLEEAVEAVGVDPSALRAGAMDWRAYEPQVAAWLDHAAPAIAEAALSACSVIDFEAIVIDGAFAPDIRRRLVEQVRVALAGRETLGLIFPRIEEGTVGANARVIGAAYGPIAAHYFVGPGPGGVAAAPETAQI